MTNLRRPLVVAGIAALMGLPAPAAGAIPEEPDAVILGGSTVSAVAVDLDADGARELVRVAVARENPAELDVEVWAEGTPAWSLVAQLPLVGPTQPVARSDAARLVVMRRAGANIAVVVVSSGHSDGCCTTLFEVSMGGGTVRLRHLAERVARADAVIVADLDADGTDELVVRSARGPAARGEQRLQVHVRDGERLRASQELELPHALSDPPFWLGDTDRRPGEEIGLLDRAASGRLARISLAADGTLKLETAALFAPRDPRQEVTGVSEVAGVGILVASTGATYTIAWPSDAEPRTLARVGLGGSLIGVIGTGREAVILLLDQIIGRAYAIDGDLNLLRLDGAKPDSAPSAWLPQFGGAIPGERHQASTVIVNGSAISVTDGEPASVPVAGFGGTHPIGMLGRGDGWIGLLRSLDPRSMSPDGGPLRTLADASDDRLSIAPRSVVLIRQPAAAVEEWVTIEEAAISSRDERDAASLQLIAGAATYGARLDVPVGSVAHLRDPGQGGRAVRSFDVVPGAAIRFTASQTESDALLLAVVTPSGRTYAVRWNISDIEPAPPRLAVEATTRLFDSAVRVHGTTDPAAWVAIGGRGVRVASDGSFATSLPASIWPHQTSVGATDALGRTTSMPITTVGFIDYLSLPWLVILATAGVLGGVWSAWRHPPRAPTGPVHDLTDIAAEIGLANAAVVAGNVRGHRFMSDNARDARPIHPNEEPMGDEAPTTDVVPEGTLRGATTIPDTNDSGMTTPPITGWGETLTGEERHPEESGEAEDRA